MKKITLLALATIITVSAVLPAVAAVTHSGTLQELNARKGEPVNPI